MKKISIISAAIIACALTGCAGHTQKVDTQEQVAEMLRKAEAGDLDAQVEACGKAMSRNTHYKPADNGDSVCERAAAQGSIYAMLDMSARYDLAFDRPKDDKKAFYWLRRAAYTPVKKDDLTNELHIREAYERMADVYEYGLMGIKPDQRAAFGWHLKAAGQQGVSSYVRLGQMYEKGLGTKQDFKAAVKWYRAAAVIGIYDGARSLVPLYLKGLGVMRNIEDAYFYSALADRLRRPGDKAESEEVSVSLMLMDMVGFDKQLEIDMRVKNWKPDYSATE